ncbi:MAG: hypothetical protein OER56_00075 [Hyphomicrobiales bacterium]|nr:hypothetical protein [Hyphomicrobiales bacterium]
MPGNICQIVVHLAGDDPFRASSGKHQGNEAGARANFDNCLASQGQIIDALLDCPVPTIVVKHREMPDREVTLGGMTAVQVPYSPPRACRVGYLQQGDRPRRFVHPIPTHQSCQ